MSSKVLAEKWILFTKASNADMFPFDDVIMQET